MMKLLLPLLLLLPFVELYLLFAMAEEIGAGAAFALVILTGIAGLTIIAREGWGTSGRLSERMQRGDDPGRALFDSAARFIGGLLLLVPGILTDIAGLLLLIPPVRRGLQRMLVAWFRRRGGHWQSTHAGFAGGDTIDATVISRHSESDYERP